MRGALAWSGTTAVSDSTSVGPTLTTFSVCRLCRLRRCAAAASSAGAVISMVPAVSAPPARRARTSLARLANLEIRTATAGRTPPPAGERAGRRDPTSSRSRAPMRVRAAPAEHDALGPSCTPEHQAVGGRRECERDDERREIRLTGASRLALAGAASTRGGRTPARAR